LLLTGACASLEGPRETGAAAPGPAPGETGGKAEKAGFAPYRQELRVPLWEDPPLGLAPEKIPALSVSLELLDPAAEGEPETAALGRLFRDIFYRSLSAQDYIWELIRIQTIEYRDMGEEARNNPRIVFSESLNWFYTETLAAEALYPRLVVVSRNRARYTGGAHGNYDRYYFVFDREAGMQVFLSDLVRDGAMPALREMVNRELRAGKKLGPADSLKKALFFVDEAELTENYFLSPRGLGFHWNPYEIAPYVEGYVEALIPYEQVRGLLSPEGQRLVRDIGE
jgi:hypothetical protein